MVQNLRAHFILFVIIINWIMRVQEKIELSRTVNSLLSPLGRGLWILSTLEGGLLERGHTKFLENFQ